MTTTNPAGAKLAERTDRADSMMLFAAGVAAVAVGAAMLVWLRARRRHLA